MVAAPERISNDSITDTTSLAAAATAWTTLGTAATNQPIPLFDQTPFASSGQEPGRCSALRWPDLGAELQDVQQLKETLRTKLLAMKVEPFGPILADKNPGLALSEGIGALKEDLDALQTEPFWTMSRWATEDEPTPGALPRFATWRTEDVDAALKTADAFDNYRGPAFEIVERGSREALLDVIEADVSELVGLRLRRTAVGRSERANDSAAVLDELKVTGSVVARLGRVASLLVQSPSGQLVLSSLDSQAAAALAAIDLQASRNYPSLFVWPRRANAFDALFSRWQDLRKTAAAADAPKLWEAIADEQRDAGPKFAPLAAPFATYLVARRALSDPALRWARIARDVASYEQKLPDNGLGAFDALVRRGIPAMLTANNCLAGSAAMTRASGEYFAPLRDELAREGERQCRIQAQRDYGTILSAFNVHLRDKFPFIDSDARSFTARLREAQGRPEATPENVKALLDAYSSADGPVLTRFLGSRGTCSSDPALAFLRAVDNASTVLASAADPQQKAPAVAFDVRPEFRLRANPVTGGDQIAEWQLEVGARTLREMGEAAAEPLVWTSGDRVSLVLRFARDSPSVPAAGAGLPLDPSAGDGRTVRFEFTGQWAIFRLLLAHTVSSVADALSLRDGGPTLLAVDIPVQPDVTKPPLTQPAAVSTFDLYMGLGLFARGKADLIKVGEFPTQGPDRISCLGI